MKNILAIHDLSCFGRCALSVIIPTLSAMSHQVTPLPTALLSTHTGGFTNMCFTDLTATMKQNFEHMRASGAHFDALYSGFLGSAAQIDTVKYMIHELSDTLICIDPVMGDEGKLYQTYTEEMKQRMSELCELATLITPNLTEAVFLLNEPYKETSHMSEREAGEYARGLAYRLNERFACEHIVITGIECKRGSALLIGTAVLSDKTYSFLTNEHVGTGYPGTGDIFASVLLGGMLKGKELVSCVDFAARFISELVLDTYAARTPIRDGVLLEDHLYKLTNNK